MGLRIPCLHCGLRPYAEFTFGGELHPIDARDPEDDFRNVFLHENAAGVQRERWFHAYGCRRWMTADRDTETNEIHGLA